MNKILLAIAIAGLIVSGYLLVFYTTGAPIPCGVHGACETVRNSSYASFFNIPTPAYGVVFYLILAVLADAWQPGASPWQRLAVWITVSAGVAVSIFLSSIEAFVIHAWCRWCVVSALLTVAAFVVVWMQDKNYE